MIQIRVQVAGRPALISHRLHLNIKALSSDFLDRESERIYTPSEPITEATDAAPPLPCCYCYRSIEDIRAASFRNELFEMIERDRVFVFEMAFTLNAKQTGVFH